MIVRRVGWLAAVAIGVLAFGAPAAAIAQGASKRPVVVLVAIPGLEWSDAAHMPTLRLLASQGAVGELSVKASGGTTRCGAGVLAVGAGNRTNSYTDACGIAGFEWANLQRDNRNSRYRSTIGLLGTKLQAAGVKTIAVGDEAAALVANEQAQVSRIVSSLIPVPSSNAVVSVLDTQLYDVLPEQRAATAAAVDSRLALVVAHLPPSATIIVAGISDLAIGHATLHTLIIRGPGWAHTQLRESAAGRAPYVQLIDIAPTILSMYGLTAPDAMVGQPMNQSGSRVPSIAKYVDDNRHAVAQRTLGQRVFLTLGIATILMMLLAVSGVGPGRAAARWLARLLAPAPMLVYAANGLPWWRWGQPTYAAIVVAGCVVIAIATTIAARRDIAAAIAVPMLATFAVLVLDQLTGGHLQLSAPLGDSPLIAGRFLGVGNLDFAVIATSAMLLAGVLGGRRTGLRSVALAGGVALVAVVVDGAPQIGDDIGGFLSLVPASIVVVAGAMKLRITKGRAISVLLGTVVVAVALALLDYSRPRSEQTHVGRFVGQILHGGAGTEVRRKLDAALASFGPTVGTFVVVIAIVLAIASHRRLRSALSSVPGLATGAAAATVAAVLGVALNDSGITIAAMAVIVGVSAVYGSGVHSVADPPSSPTSEPEAIST